MNKNVKTKISFICIVLTFFFLISLVSALSTANNTKLYYDNGTYITYTGSYTTLIKTNNIWYINGTVYTGALFTPTPTPIQTPYMSITPKPTPYMGSTTPFLSGYNLLFILFFLIGLNGLFCIKHYPILAFPIAILSIIFIIGFDIEINGLTIILRLILLIFVLASVVLNFKSFRR